MSVCDEYWNSSLLRVHEHGGLSFEETLLCQNCCRAPKRKFFDMRRLTLCLNIYSDRHNHRKRERLRVNKLERKDLVSSLALKLLIALLNLIHYNCNACEGL